MQLAVDLALATGQPLGGLLDLPPTVLHTLRLEVERRAEQERQQELREQLRNRLGK